LKNPYQNQKWHAQADWKIEYAIDRVGARKKKEREEIGL
jgi:hypothetical protein